MRIEDNLEALRRNIDQQLTTGIAVEPEDDGGGAYVETEEPISSGRRRSSENGRLDSEGEIAASDRAAAFREYKSLMDEFSHLRDEGRSVAWAAYQRKMSLAANRFVKCGLLDIKSMNGMLLEIEQFRKSEQGTQENPTDALKSFLCGSMTKETAEVLFPEDRQEVVPRAMPRARTPKTILDKRGNQKQRMKRLAAEAAEGVDL